VKWSKNNKYEKKPKKFKKAVSKLMDKLVKYMNEFICKVVGMAGASLYIQTEVRRNDDSRLLTTNTISRRKDMHEKFTTSSFTIPGSAKMMTPMTIWDTSCSARVLSGKIVFDPRPGANAEAQGNFNLYGGPDISREEALASVPAGSTAAALIKPWLDHIKDIWCNGDAAVYEYDLNWFAQIIQKPWKKTCVAIYLIGEQGAGKGLPLQQISAIIGSGFYETRDVDTVIGQYQHESLKHNILTFLDECTFSKDKKQQARLKGLVTESKKDWSAKYINPITIGNFSNIIGASNAKKVVNVEQSDRRNLIQHVNQKYAGKQTPASQAYAKRVLDVLPEHVAAFLYTRDISNFNSRAYPTSSAHVEHKIRSLEVVPSFWHETLMSGVISTAPGNIDIQLSAGPNTVRKDAVFKAFKHFEASQRKAFRETVHSVFWKSTKTIFEQQLVAKDGSVTDFKLNSRQNTMMQRDANGNLHPMRAWKVDMPSWSDMRSLFQVYMKEQAWPWSDEKKTPFVKGAS
jgi:hypothetical protein